MEAVPKEQEVRTGNRNSLKNAYEMPHGRGGLKLGHQLGEKEPKPPFPEEADATGSAANERLTYVSIPKRATANEINLRLAVRLYVLVGR